MSFLSRRRRPSLVPPAVVPPERLDAARLAAQRAERQVVLARLRDAALDALLAAGTGWDTSQRIPQATAR